MSDYAQRIMTQMQTERDALGLIAGKSLPPEARDKVLNGMVALFIGEAQKSWEARHREKKRGAVLPEASEIYKLYPRHEGGQASLLAISKAINDDGLDLVRDKTREYGEAVKRWQHNRRTSANGSSLIPLPATWFGNRRYALDDSKEWWAGTGAALAREEKEAVKLSTPEPRGWRQHFPDFIHVDSAWTAIDATTQRYIIDNLPGAKTG